MPNVRKQRRKDGQRKKGQTDEGPHAPQVKMEKNENGWT